MALVTFDQLNDFFEDTDEEIIEKFVEDLNAVMEFYEINNKQRISMFLAQVGHEYLIEQVQFGGQESVTGSNQKVKLDFNHPCKEIVWAVRVGAFGSKKAYLAHHQKSEQQQIGRAHV